ncbi:MAG: hypothetical protein CL779_01260 [Chloroflexi bacterium]|nr:hypothetical protein [Chloroflexota bacterium]|tara:strand:- start:2517 stop:3047 length:531 start_codon:yes stop_codon:yes gene_type:complete
MILKSPDTNLITQGNLVSIRIKIFDDLYNDYAWRKDPEISKYDAVPPLSVTFNDFVDRHNLEYSKYSKERAIFSIYSNSEYQHIGNIMFYNLNNMKKNVEIGITIGEKDFWSRGYGTEALSLFVEYIFSVLKVKSIYLHTLNWNERAYQAFVKSGFYEVKKVRRLGHLFIKMEINK